MATARQYFDHVVKIFRGDLGCIIIEISFALFIGLFWVFCDSNSIYLRRNDTVLNKPTMLVGGTHAGRGDDWYLGT